MLRHHTLSLTRIEQLCARMRDFIYPEKRPIQTEGAGPVGRIRYDEAQCLEYRPFQVGEELGPYGSTFWFRLRGQVPKEWAGRRVDLLWVSHSEATLWRGGMPVQGLNYEPANSTCLRPDAKLWDCAPAEAPVCLSVEVACNQLNGYNWRLTPSYKNRTPFVFEQADLAVFDREAWDFYYDFKVLCDLLKRTDPKIATPWGGYLLSSLNSVANALRPEDRNTWDPAREQLKELLAFRNATFQQEVSAIGHGHIDTAWLWPIAETKRKCVRTFSSVLAYAADYPEYRFACSQAQQYQWMKEEQPALYAGIQAAAAKGNWVPVGGTWVEPDCNLPSGESLVRQFLYGQRFFEREFGARSTVFWNPDVFGYSGALPQIMRKAGIEFFLTQKLSWNQFNKPLHHNFEWEGIDGSRVLTHFPPSDTYSGMWAESGFPLKDLLHGSENYKDHDRTRESLFAFGFGDGGGGPTREMLEVLRRVEDLQGVPRTRQRSPEEFFRRLKADLQDVPRMVGELYFEYHRGTYTSQAALKKGNRQCEFQLREVELLAAVAQCVGAPYPQKEIEGLWKLVLLNQFHDILPGSSITEVNQEARQQHAQVIQGGARLKNAAQKVLARSGGHSIFNPCGWERTALVRIPNEVEGMAQRDAEGHPLGWVKSDGIGCGPLIIEPSPAAVVTLREADGRFVLENGLIRAEFLTDGTLAYLYDKQAERQVAQASEPGNQFVIFEDRPHDYDAWEIDVTHLETRSLLPPAASCSVLERGPARAALEFAFAFGSSVLREKVFLEADSRMLRFACDVDWHERHKVLKVEFPVQVRAMEAAFEIQFGHVLRPTHFNTMQEIARFESCAHKWVDLGEYNYGVALLSESKYGFAVHGSTIRLSLLRAPTYPDPEADQGLHQFEFALYPHCGNLMEAQVVQHAYEFNCPMRFLPGAAAVPAPWFQVDSPNLIIDTVKKAEDSGDLVVRLYEAYGTAGKAKLSSALKFRKAWKVNLLEDAGEELAWRDGVTLAFSPFEILSLKLEK